MPTYNILQYFFSIFFSIFFPIFFAWLFNHELCKIGLMKSYYEKQTFNAN